MEENETLGRFGHHPDAATDFCIEVECCENDAYDLRAGGDREALLQRIDRAMTFRVGGDPDCVKAKLSLRQLWAAIHAGIEGAWVDALIKERSLAHGVEDFEAKLSGSDFKTRHTRLSRYLSGFNSAYHWTRCTPAGDLDALLSGLTDALTECHDVLHECTAVLSASDCAKVSAVMGRARTMLGQ